MKGPAAKNAAGLIVALAAEAVSVPGV